MHYFQFYVAPKSVENVKPSNIAVVRDGFHFFALIFTPFWLLWHKAWLWFGIYIALQLLFSIAIYILQLDPLFGELSSLFLSLIFALESDYILSQTLESKGYTIDRIIPSKNLEEAEFLYFHSK